MGLAIAKRIADTHQAKLSATSEAAQDTCFTILFPGLRVSKPGDSERDVSLKQPLQATPHV